MPKKKKKIQLALLTRYGGQRWNNLRSLRSRIIDNSYLVRQMRLTPGEAMVRQICIISNFVSIGKTIKQALLFAIAY